ncbi:eukaryotic translation initiation factor 4 gamma isoform X1 [Phlebotomus papatasi]|uniref:eukaryotic translation initiation factor 4 gamma isoform X1 n=1 Tax=Phlebotomus papatasi TaxID=29031 RepID=UPI002483BB85|nr:eukaryotic translation initiation factor 4 gamma isoform X1 [Phlebotomus papatasi]
MTLVRRIIVLNICLTLCSIVQAVEPSQRNAGTQASRRQLTPVQQSHILADIQQHQHRFNVHQGQNVPGKTTFVQQPSLSVAFPPQTTLVQNRPVNPFIGGHGSQYHLAQQPSQTNYRSILPPRHTLRQTPQSQYQRSVQNQLHQSPQFSNVRFPSNPYQFHISPTLGQQLPTLTSLQNQGGFPEQPIVGQPQISGQQNQFLLQPQFSQLSEQQQFLQQPNFQLPSEQPPISHQPLPQQPLSQQPLLTGNFGQHLLEQQLPFQQQQQLFRDSRTDEERIRDLKERERLIQKQEQFVQKQYQKQQMKAQKLHQEFLQTQQQIKLQSQYKTKQASQAQFIPRYPNSRTIAPHEQDTFQRALKEYHELHPTTPTTTVTTESSTAFLPTTTTKRSKSRNEITISTPEQLEQLLQGQISFSQVKGSPKGKTKAKTSKGLGREDLIRQLKLALAEQPQDLQGKNFTSMDLVLPDGQKVQVIRTTDPNLIKNATPLTGDSESLLTQYSTAQTSRNVYDELAKSGVLPPGADFEVIKQSSDGKLEEVAQLPPQKKVTFVYLEEQQDGTYKVQGVKANGDKAPHTSGAEVESIIERIKKGEIQLPPPSNRAREEVTSTEAPIRSSSSPATISISSTSSYDDTSFASSPRVTSSRSTYVSPASVSPYSTIATPSSENSVYYTGSPSTRVHSTTAAPYISSTFAPEAAPLVETTLPATEQASSTANVDTIAKNDEIELATILKNGGLHAMAKYLKQSGLDTILNETGPYTIFAPTDKAFKNLLVQLGGPEKAEEKFRNNPRLLSGLLLHHVIPGSFEISTLQDEMTGVSLAGTQLRVNQYKLHDAEWNDVKVTTINGAMVVPDKQDIKIPQGVAQGLDRVMFPLPVGDLLQTLQSDRERRFTTFLRAVFAADLSELLQIKGSKTYTVFAPTDEAFAKLPAEEVNEMVTDREKARTLVTNHISPGTLYSAGMRFYQIRESMSTGKPITLQKNTGTIKINSGKILTSNIPSTNGVIHVVDTLL